MEALFEGTPGGVPALVAGAGVGKGGWIGGGPVEAEGFRGGERKDAARHFAEGDDQVMFLGGGDLSQGTGGQRADVHAAALEEVAGAGVGWAGAHAGAVEDKAVVGGAAGDGLGEVAEAGVGIVHEEDAEGVGMGVAEELAGAEEDDLLADVLGLVGDAFEAAGDGEEGGEAGDGELSGALPVEEAVTDLVAELVGGILDGDGLAGEGFVFVAIGLEGPLEHVDGEGGLFGEGGEFGGRIEAMDAEGLAGDAFGAIADPFEFADDAEGGVDEAEGAAGGLVADEEFETEAFAIGLVLIEETVAEDDGTGLGDVAVEEGIAGAFDGTDGHGAHEGDVGAQAVHRLLEVEFEVGAGWGVHGWRAMGGLMDRSRGIFGAFPRG